MEHTKQKLKNTTKCVKCGHLPMLIHYDYDMWYIKCSNSACTKYGQYEMLGKTRELAIEQWERANRPINRYYQKGLKNATNSKQSTDS